MTISIVRITDDRFILSTSLSGETHGIGIYEDELKLLVGEIQRRFDDPSIRTDDWFEIRPRVVPKPVAAE